MSEIIFPEGRGTTASTGDEDSSSPLAALSKYWALLRKYYWVLFITCVIGVAGGYFYTLQQPRVYASSAKLMFHESPDLFGGSIERVNLIDPGGRWQFEQFWNTQKAILRSKWFAEKVALESGLLADAELVPTERAGETLSDEERLDIAAGRILGMSTLELQENSRVAIVSTEATDPQLAAAVANAIAATYIDYVKGFQSGGLNEMIDWFDKYVSAKQAELDAAQRELHQYKRDHNILSISFEDRQNLTGSNMQAVNSSLNEVRASLARERAFLEQIETMEQSEKDLRSLATLTGSGSLSGLISQEANLRVELSRLRAQGLLDQHPEVRAVTQALETVRENVQSEIDRYIAGSRARVQALERQQVSLERRLDEISNQAFELDGLGLQYNQLKDKAENLKQLYQTVLKRSEELDINSTYDHDVVQVLEEAEVPAAPIRPNPPVNLGIGLLVGLLLGAGILVLIDLFDQTIRSDEDILPYTDSPILGMLPEVEKSALKGLIVHGDNQSPLDTMTHLAPKSPFAEAIKTLRTNLTFMAADSPPRLLLVTSPGPGEGKTLISSNMAIAMAQSGLKTLLVDADLRRPRVHKALGFENTEGLSNVIAGQLEASEVIRTTEIDHLFTLPAGTIPPNPTELFHTARFERLVEELEGKFDRVIFDSPPIGAVADSLIVSNSVDAVLLIVKYGQTRRDMLRRAIEQLGAIGAPLMGSVINDIKKDGGAYGYSHYYYYRYGTDDHHDEPTVPHKLVG